MILRQIIKLIIKMWIGRKNKLIANASWLVLHRVSEAVLAMTVFVFLARYLGPDGLGLINYAQSFVAVFSIVAVMGLDRIAIKMIVENKKMRSAILGTSFYLRLTAGLIAWMAAVILVWFIGRQDAVILVAIIGAGFLWQSFFVVNFHFQAEIKSVYFASAQIISALLLNIFLLFLIYVGARLQMFAWAYFIGSFLSAVLLLVAYKIDVGNFLDWKFDVIIAKKLLFGCWPLIVSGLAVLLIGKIPYLMMGRLSSADSIGYFAASDKLVKVWNFIPLAATLTLYPQIVEAKKKDISKYMNNFQSLYIFAIWFSLIMSFFIWLFAGKLIWLLYGASYEASVLVLMIYAWTLPFISLTFINRQFFVIENRLLSMIWRELIVVLFSVVVQYLLVVRYGAVGSAIGVLVSYAFLVLLIIGAKSCKFQLVLMVNSFRPSVIKTFIKKML